MRPSRPSHAFIAFAVAFAVILMSARPIAANTFGSTACGGSPRNCVSVSYDRFHYAYFFLVESSMYSATLVSIWNDYDPTDLVAAETTNSAIADVIVEDANFGLNGVAGWVECPSSEPDQGGAHPNHWCQGQYLRYNYTYSTYFDDAVSLAYMACHEFGHTVGLQHSTEGASCMTANTPNGSGSLTAHDRGHINTRY